MLALLAHVYKVQTLQQASGHLALLICLAQLLPLLSSRDLQWSLEDGVGEGMWWGQLTGSLLLER